MAAMAGIIAIIRNERMLVPGAGVEFQAGDRMMLVIDSNAIESLREHMDLGV